MVRRVKGKQLATRLIMLPKDTNGHGKISGGVLLSQIDIAGAVVARGFCSSTLVNRIVTRAMDDIEFEKPVLVNDILSCYGHVTKTGHTSISVHVDVEVERNGVVSPVTQAEVTYVAVNSNGKPCALTCGNAGDKKRRTHHKSELEKLSGPPAISATSTFPTEEFYRALLANRTPAEKAAVMAKLTQAKPVSKKLCRVIALKKAMMPFELNGMGNIFGGVLLSDMDLAGFYVAQLACTNRQIATCVTRAMKKVEFKRPVHVNDLITCYGTVVSIGQTAVTVLVEVEAIRPGETIAVTKAEVTYVALDAAGQSTSILK
jgi:acyl-CoA thioesterase YciA